MYAEWMQIWKNKKTQFKHTKLFFPIMDPKRSKNLLKMNRLRLKKMVEIITGHNNFRAFSTKIKKLDDISCRFCKTQDNENVDHLLHRCTYFKQYRNETKLKYHLPLTNNEQLNWSIPLIENFFDIPELSNILNTKLGQG